MGTKFSISRGTAALLGGMKTKSELSSRNGNSESGLALALTRDSLSLTWRPGTISGNSRDARTSMTSAFPLSRVPFTSHHARRGDDDLEMERETYRERSLRKKKKNVRGNAPFRTLPYTCPKKPPSPEKAIGAVHRDEAPSHGARTFSSCPLVLASSTGLRIPSRDGENFGGGVRAFAESECLVPGMTMDGRGACVGGCGRL